MNGLMLNYILLAITGGYCLVAVILMIKGQSVANKPLRTICFFVLFILVLIATIKGMDIDSFRRMIESGQWR
jgi:hypothetical protein